MTIRLRAWPFAGLGFLCLFLGALAQTDSPASASGRDQVGPPSTGLAAAIEGLEFREIGPAIMGGRVDDISVVESDPKVVYVGFASGGVWKTTNAGTTWTPLFDKQPVSSIGAVAVAPSDPSVVWVGTGEANNRQSSSWGDGVYKSMDAGLTWRHMGLAETHHIGHIVVHPADADVVYVAALGRLWGPNRERGVFKSVDGGTTWQHILYINDDTGVVDLALDPSNPEVLLAAAYERRRTVYGFDGGGPHGAIYKTTDAGATWRKLTKGLPYEDETDGETGRIGLKIYRRNPAVIYATVEHARGGVFRSEDSGETWTRMSETNPRPCYFSKLAIDPNDDRRIWVMGKLLYFSEDGGRTFKTPPVRYIHGDYHAMWINPADSNHVILGSDGGLTWSWDGGKTWDVVNNLPVGQFYELGLDNQKPYTIYGGLQDNGVWGGPSRALILRGVASIANDDWFRVAGADGFYVQADPTDPRTVYAETQNGAMFRRDLRTFESRSIKPLEGANDPGFRFQWNTPFAVSSHDPRTLYCGAQFVFKSTDRGDNWTIISPDLTTGMDRAALPILGKIPDAKDCSLNDGVSSWPCITTLSESPADPAVLWAGTDDGNLQVTRDGGRTWRNVSGRIPGLPAGTYVSRVVASRYGVASAYAVFDGHRMNDFRIYVYATTDLGETWQPISAGLPSNNAAVHVIREHPRNPNLLFAGTEHGAYISFDKGLQWIPLRGNLPTVPVDDIAIQPRDNDLVLGTHGRSIWVLDDITPLEELNQDVLAQSLYLFNLRPAIGWSIHSQEAAPGHKAFSGSNPPLGALINYWVKPGPAVSVKARFVIKDSSGQTVREWSTEARAGLNREVWDLRYTSPAAGGGGKIPGAPSFRRGPVVEPGVYVITVFAGEERRSRRVVIEGDPRIKLEAADREARHLAIMRAYELSGTALRSLREVDRLAASVKEISDSQGFAGARRPKLDALAKSIEEIKACFITPRGPEEEVGSPLERIQPTILQRLGRLCGELEGFTAAPTGPQVRELESVAAQLAETRGAIAKLSEMVRALTKAKNQKIMLDK